MTSSVRETAKEMQILFLYRNYSSLISSNYLPWSRSRGLPAQFNLGQGITSLKLFKKCYDK